MENASEAASSLVSQINKSLNLKFRSRFVLPGDDCTKEVSQPSESIKLGNGLVSTVQGNAMATKAGLLRYQAPNIYRIDNHQRRYIPKVDDPILGIVEDRQGEQYRVNIFGSTNGYLPHLAFEGATKRNKPNLRVGTLVYCRVSLANKDMDTEISCIATQGIKKDWMTGESTFGELKGGTLTRCSHGLSRQLLAKDCKVLQALSKVHFELAVGRNGCFWANAEDHRITIAVVNAILNSEEIQHKKGIEAMCKHVLAAASSSAKRLKAASS